MEKENFLWKKKSTLLKNYNEKHTHGSYQFHADKKEAISSKVKQDKQLGLDNSKVFFY